MKNLAGPAAVILFSALIPSLLAQTLSGPQATPTPHHEANFDTERAQANELFLAQKILESLPLYEDLSRQDPTIAVFAERHGSGLLAKAATIPDPKAKQETYQQAIQEFKRAQSLGDNSAYVRTVLENAGKNLVGAILSGFPLSIGYTYHGKPEAQAVFQQAEAAFAHSDWDTAVKLYIQAATIDPTWYTPAICAGDAYFHLKDLPNASLWFTKAIAIDPDRETAYRYWGDAIFQSGDANAAREKFLAAVVAEPYSQAALGGLQAWAKRTGHQIAKPAITRPEFVTPNGVLQIDPALAASTQDGRSSWILYQQYRVAHGARVLNQIIIAGSSDAKGVIGPSGYRHTIAEEHAALRAMLEDIEAKLKAGTLTETSLDPSIRNIRNLEKAGNLGAWIAINAADAGIRSDYPEYRAKHRQHLIEYVNTYLIH